MRRPLLRIAALLNDIPMPPFSTLSTPQAMVTVQPDAPGAAFEAPRG
jgi:hypothetical protein